MTHMWGRAQDQCILLHMNMLSELLQNNSRLNIISNILGRQENIELMTSMQHIIQVKKQDFLPGHCFKASLAPALMIKSIGAVCTNLWQIKHLLVCPSAFAQTHNGSARHLFQHSLYEVTSQGQKSTETLWISKTPIPACNV